MCLGYYLFQLKTLSASNQNPRRVVRPAYLAEARQNGSRPSLTEQRCHSPNFCKEFVKRIISLFFLLVSLFFLLISLFCFVAIYREME